MCFYCDCETNNTSRKPQRINSKQVQFRDIGTGDDCESRQVLQPGGHPRTVRQRVDLLHQLRRTDGSKDGEDNFRKGRKC